VGNRARTKRQTLNATTHTMTSKFTLVLTGEVLPGFASAAVWPSLVAHFRVEPQKLDELLARAPCVIKEDGNLDKLQTLQAGIARIGAQTEICPTNQRPALHVWIEGASHGPVPQALVEQRIEQGQWAETISVSEAGSSQWRSYCELYPVTPKLPPAPVSTPVLVPAAVADDDGSPALAGARYLARAAAAESVAGSKDAQAEHSAGNMSTRKRKSATSYAGFWQRCSALGYDIRWFVLGFLILCVPSAVLALGESPWSTYLLNIYLVTVFCVGFWRFPKEQSSSLKATSGMRKFGIKLVDKEGRRIGLAHARWRYFLMPGSWIIIFYLSMFHSEFLWNYKSSVIYVAQGAYDSPSSSDLRLLGITSLTAGITAILVIVWSIGYLMSCWTRYKQTLFDKMAGTFLVCDDLESADTTNILEDRSQHSEKRSALRFLPVAGIILFAMSGADLMFQAASTQSTVIRADEYRGAENQKRPLPFRVSCAVNAVEYGEKIGTRNCPAGRFPIPEDPTLGDVDVVDEGADICTVTITLADSDELGELRGEKIRLRRKDYWSCKFPKGPSCCFLPLCE
jgi:uncharacterized RDD family membrane protein YckC